MTVLDIVLLVGFVGFVFLGFAQGVVKVLFVILATYLGLMVAAVIYQPTAEWMAPFFLGKGKASTTGYELIVFFVLMFLIVILLVIFLFSSFRYAALPNSLQSIDRVGGMVLGGVLGVFFLSIVVIFLKTAGGVLGTGGAESIPLIGFAITDVGKSSVAQVLLNTRDVIKTLISPLVNVTNNPLFTPGLNG